MERNGMLKDEERFQEMRPCLSWFQDFDFGDLEAAGPYAERKVPYF